ncbi:protein of unknown function [Paraburkholderia kururiensis]
MTERAGGADYCCNRLFQSAIFGFIIAIGTIDFGQSKGFP